jgi:hypothetical protein
MPKTYRTLKEYPVIGAVEKIITMPKGTIVTKVVAPWNTTKYTYAGLGVYIPADIVEHNPEWFEEREKPTTYRVLKDYIVFPHTIRKGSLIRDYKFCGYTFDYTFSPHEIKANPTYFEEVVGKKPTTSVMQELANRLEQESVVSENIKLKEENAKLNIFIKQNSKGMAKVQKRNNELQKENKALLDIIKNTELKQQIKTAYETFNSRLYKQPTQPSPKYILKKDSVNGKKGDSFTIENNFTYLTDDKGNKYSISADEGIARWLIHEGLVEEVKPKVPRKFFIYKSADGLRAEEITSEYEKRVGKNITAGLSLIKVREVLE